MRRLGIIAAVIFLVVVVAVAIFAATFDVNKYRGTIQSQLEKRLGRPVLLGDMGLSLFPPRFRVQNLAIADDTRFSPDAPFIRAQELDVSVKLLPLLHRQFEIDSLSLQRPIVNLIKNSAGVWNFASLGHPAETSNTQPRAQAPQQTVPPNQPASPAQQPPQPSAEQQFSLGKLTIQDGQISLLDQQQSKSPTLYDHIDLTLTNFAPNEPFTVDAAAHMAGAGSQEMRVQGEGGPLVREQPATTPFHGTVNLKQVGIADFSKFLNSPVLAGTDGVLTGQTKIQSDQGKLSVQGETNVLNAKLKGMELGYPIAVQYDLTDDLPVDMITIRSMILKLGPTPLELSGTVNAKPTPAQLALNIKANNVSLAEAAKLLAASGVALSQGTTVTGNASANIEARGAANKPALNGTITASNLQMSGKDIAQPIQIPSATLNLTPSQIQSNSFNIISGGTTLNAQLGVRNYLSPSPMVDATVRAPNAQLPAILSLAKAYGVTALDKVNGAGTMNLDMRAVGPVKSLSRAEIIRALNGSTNLNFNNVKYSGANLSQQLASIAGFLNATPTAQTAQGITNILKMTGDIMVRNGIAQTNNLQAQLDIGTVGAAGTANLENETLNMRVTAVLSQASSQKVGGQNIGGFMKTALANNQGQLVIPAVVTGTFSNPRFAPDVQQLGQMKLKGLIPNMGNPASVTGALQNLLGGPKPLAQGQQQQRAEPQPQQADPLQQVIGIFGKKKQQKPQPPQRPK
jgi:AsmA protein